MNDLSNFAVVVVALEEAEGEAISALSPTFRAACPMERRGRGRANTEEALAEWIEAQVERGREFPKPGSAAADARRREIALLDAIRSLADYRSHADEKIASLDRKLKEVIALLSDDRGQLPTRFAVSSIDPEKRRRSPLG